jgi:Ca2+-binding RTX toxin-like protein
MANNVTNLDVLSGETPVTVLFTGGVSTADYAIVGGPDASMFGLTHDGVSSSAARLVFLQPPDIAHPTDVGGDNIYQVDIAATASGTTIVTTYNLHVAPDDYSGSTSTMGSILTDGTPVTGSLALRTDTDWFRFDASGGSYLVFIDGATSAGIRAADGRSFSSWGGSSGLPQMVNLTAGTYYLEVGSPTGSISQFGLYTAYLAESGPMIYPTENDDVRNGSEIADMLWGNGGIDTLLGNGGVDFITGGAGDDSIDGGVAGDRIGGDDGDDQLFGAPGNDSVDGGTGNDSIDAGADDDFVRGLDGNDTITGGGGNDDVNGNKGLDVVRGGEGADWVRGGQGNDTVYGESGEDPHVNGNLGDDWVYGGEGNDTAYGGQGDDRLYGEAGADYLSGDLGNDTLVGGPGADHFVFRAGAGRDQVSDFNAAEGDRVVLPSGTPYAVSALNGNAVIDLGGGHTLTLVGIGQMSADWIVFG